MDRGDGDLVRLVCGAALDGGGDDLPGGALRLDDVDSRDDIVLNLNVRDGIITGGSYEGSGCTISQASADMMLDLVIGKSVDEAKKLSDIFMRMIKETVTEDELEQLEEAAALQDISHMPSRVKCAVLGWRTMNEIIENKVCFLAGVFIKSPVFFIIGYDFIHIIGHIRDNAVNTVVEQSFCSVSVIDSPRIDSNTIFVQSLYIFCIYE